MLNRLTDCCFVRTSRRFSAVACCVLVAGAVAQSFAAAEQALAAEPGLAPSQLRCEYLVNPPGIDETHPRLSWVVESEPAGPAPNRLPDPGRQRRETLAAARAICGTAARWRATRRRASPMTARALASQQRCFWKTQGVGQGRQSLCMERTSEVVHGVAEAARLEGAVHQLSATPRRCTGSRSRSSCRRPGNIERSLSATKGSPPGDDLCDGAGHL